MTTVQVSACPVCKGTTRREYTGPHADILAGYDANDSTVPCQNCGGQYMFGTPLGMVKHNADGEPCTHEYHLAETKNCLRTYTCLRCGDLYQIDSGD